MTKTPHFRCLMAAKGKARIELYDEIGPEWLGMIEEKTIARALKEIGNVAEIELRVNSLGGDAYDGLAIGNMLKNHPAKVHGFIEGIAASAATLVLMGCDTITMPKNALMMIHDPVTFAFGDEEEMRRRVEQLVTAKKAGVEAYAGRNKKKTKDEIAALMKEETWFTGEEAVEAGFADRTEAEVQLPTTESATPAVTNRFRNAPSHFVSLLAVSMRANMENPKMADTTTTTTPAADAVPVTQTAAPAPPAPAPAPTPAAPATPASPTQAAEDPAVLERKRCAEITALCNQIGKPDLAADFIDKGTSVFEVQQHAIKVMCADRRPTDSGGSGNPAPTTDPDAKFKAEYAADRVLLQKSGVTEEEYVASRRVTEEHQGSVAMLPKAKVA